MRVKFAWLVVWASALACDDVEGTDPVAQRAPLVRAQETARLREDVRASLSRDPALLQRVERSDGVQQLHVTGGFQHATMVVRKPSGERVQACVTDADQALQLLGQSRP